MHDESTIAQACSLWVGTFGQVGCNNLANKPIFTSPTSTVYRLNRTVPWLRLARQAPLHTWAGLEHPRESRWKAVRAFSPRSPSSFFPWSHSMAIFKSEAATGFWTPAGPLSCLSATNSCSETARNCSRTRSTSKQATARAEVLERPSSLVPGYNAGKSGNPLGFAQVYRRSSLGIASWKGSTLKTGP